MQVDPSFRPLGRSPSLVANAAGKEGDSIECLNNVATRLQLGEGGRREEEGGETEERKPPPCELM